MTKSVHYIPYYDNKMIVNKSSSDSCHVLLYDSTYKLQYLISAQNELTLTMNGSYELIPKLELASKLM